MTKSNDSLSVVKTCQEGTLVYPVRLALQTARLKACQTESKPLCDLTEWQQDYERRLLRAGYVYILALDVAPEEKISAKSGMYAWYIYKYDSPDVAALDEVREASADFSFTQYHFYDNKIHQEQARFGMALPYIHLPAGISHIDMMYSDIFLPDVFLQKLIDAPAMRKRWMRHIVLGAPDTGCTPLIEVAEAVKDFHNTADNQLNHENNLICYTPIGYRREFGELLERLEKHYGKAFIIELPDEIGTARDLAAYQVYLDEERKAILHQYDYAISTAQLIQAEVHKQRIAQINERDIANENGNAAWYTPTVKEKAQIYQELKVKDIHLTAQSHQDIFETLKTALNLTALPSGINAVEKMAKLPTLYGEHFKHLVSVHLAHILSQKEKLADWTSLLQSSTHAQTVAAIIGSYSLYLHGLLWGVDLSSYGYNTLLEAIYRDDFKLPPESQTLDKAAVEQLHPVLSMSVYPIIAGSVSIADTSHFEVLKFDFLVSLIADKLYTRTAKYTKSRQQNEVVRAVKNIHRIYEINPFTKQAEIKQNEVINRDIRIKARYPSPPKPNPKSHPLYQLDGAPTLKIHEEGYRVLNPRGQLAGLQKMLGYSVIFGYIWQSNSATTALGRFSNDPTVGMLTLFAGLNAPKSYLEKTIERAANEIQKEATFSKVGQLLLAETKPNFLTHLKAAFISMNTALAGLAVVIEIGYGYEAYYKGDTVGMYAAIMRGSGTLLSSTSIGLIGVAKATTNMQWLVRFGYVGLAAGSVILVAGIITDFFKQPDIVTWVDNGFWGGSKLYWGEEARAYEWAKSKRYEEFKPQLDYSLFSNPKIYDYYKIEMQRYFNFSSEIEVHDENQFLFFVNYKGIYSQADVDNIRIESPITVRCPAIPKTIYDPPYNEYRVEGNTLRYQVLFETEGVAKIIISPQQVTGYLRAKQYYFPTPVQFNYGDINYLSMSVSIPTYQGSEYRKHSNQTAFNFKG
ncbi:hypothetical protein BKG96_05740 [Rodentibacter caecimuris]|uniref:Toxin VasX N-terminal region domain-containing protein n=1 Tax=Rodentibacter caecimuris TaxID=1796644 RepID=A0A1V3KLZ4_9PAST|nr:toxin VasX [Rodentibacter heylii]OOF78420.1 hypothetical protein BKG96_05740 [Rodentibacter heylii]